jgi:transcription elongation GreA/GreB family factor
VSRAFTREEDAEAAADDVADRPISPHPNLVTAEGLAALDAALAGAREAYAQVLADGGAAPDRSRLARAARDLKYYAARRASAQLVDAPAEPGVVRFGSKVSFEREDGRRQAFRIVGEDEADPREGAVSHVSPLARALLGKRIGDAAMVASGEVEIIGID